MCSGVTREVGLTAFHERMASARTKHGVSAIELARRLGLSRSALYQWESGRASPRVANLRAWADALKLDAVERAALGMALLEPAAA
jgi:transcriptional regulator with XRE-family HTH domain